MPYQFAQERLDYSDFAAGPVFYSMPGRPAFPVRLASEVFQRCRAHLLRLDSAGPYAVYDPCCGSGYLLATLGYLHRPAIRVVLASDIDPSVIPLAERNLSLLAPPGVDARVAQLEQLYLQFGKPAHAEALASARRLRALLSGHQHLPPIQSRAFVADALDGPDLRRHLARGAADLVITDLPYGQRTRWQAAAPDPGRALLEALREIVGPASIVAITASKDQKVAHEGYERVEQFQVGKRRVRLFRPR
jgi:SAM-dependent methyltransferase